MSILIIAPMALLTGLFERLANGPEPQHGPYTHRATAFHI